MVMFVGDASASNWSTVFIRDALDASAGTAPLGLAAYLAFQLLGRIVADRVIGWLGSMSTVIIGSLVAAAGFALVAAAPTPILAIAGFALIGLGLCVVVPISFSAADALDTTGTGVVVARVNLYNYAGFVVGAALVGLIAGVVGLRWAFVLPGALVLAIVALSPVFRVADVPRTRAARSMAAR
jgi:MFS family permease